MQTYFFVYVGISLQFGSLAIYATGFLIVLLIMAFRIPGTLLLTGKGVPKPEKTIMAVMTPKDLVSVVLAFLPLQRGLAHGDLILDLGYSIVLFSIFICSVLVVILEVDPCFFNKILRPQKRKLEEDSDLVSHD